MTIAKHDGKRAPACVMAIFGVTGDLTKRLLLPSLYNLVSVGALADDFRFLGIGRRDWNDDTLKDYVGKSLKEFWGKEPDAKIVSWLVDRTYYQKANFDEKASFEALHTRIEGIAPQRGVTPNRLFYLSIAPEFIATIVGQLGGAKLLQEQDETWSRVIIEKPFGHDVNSAVALDAELRKSLDEKQIYRIDHFAGKDAVQDLSVFRFSNAIIEPLWHRSLVDSVQITVAETVGLEGRAGFYEKSGALRDMVPNHLAEMLTLVAMEPPVSFSVEHMRAKQVDLLESVRRIKPEEVNRYAVRAQYGAGQVDGKTIPAYREESGVPPNTQTETYVALKVEIDNWRWSGVPFFLRTGKSLAKGVTEIVVKFRQAPARLFPDFQCVEQSNEMVFDMKPGQGIHLNFCARAPGLQTRVMGGDMAFEFPQGPFGTHAKGYEQPLHDAMLGDPMLFASAEFVEQGWRLVQPLLDAWQPTSGGQLPRYAAGSEGPKEADALLAQTGHTWRSLRR